MTDKSPKMKSSGREAGLPGCKSQLCCSPAVELWASHLRVYPSAPTKNRRNTRTHFTGLVREQTAVALGGCLSPRLQRCAPKTEHRAGENGPKPLVYLCLANTKCAMDVTYCHDYLIIRKNMGLRVCLTQVQILVCLHNRFVILGK